MKCEKLGNHTISYQSLLLSTTVLNDSNHQGGAEVIIVSFLKVVYPLAMYVLVVYTMSWVPYQ